MRAGSTYRASRRNAVNSHGVRKLNPAFQRREGSKGKSVEPIGTLYVPPTHPNRRDWEGTRIAVPSEAKRMVVPNA